MVHVSRNAFQAIDDQFAHGSDIFVQIRVIHHPNRAPFGKQGSHFEVFGMPASPIRTTSGAIGVVQFVTASLGTFAQVIPPFNGFLNQLNEAIGVKVGVGDGGKKRLGNEEVSLIVLDAHWTSAGAPERNAF